jgi:hypothetical protein
MPAEIHTVLMFGNIVEHDGNPYHASSKIREQWKPKLAILAFFLAR